MEKKGLDNTDKSNTIVYTVSIQGKEIQIRWNELKNKRLKRIRSISFEEIIYAEFLGIEGHPQRVNQRLLIYRHKGRVWVVPAVPEPKGVFLKTIYASRKFKKIYEERGKNEKNEIDKRRAMD